MPTKIAFDKTQSMKYITLKINKICRHADRMNRSTDKGLWDKIQCHAIEGKYFIAS